jgi:hypothetical protein
MWHIINGEKIGKEAKKLDQIGLSDIINYMKKELKKEKMNIRKEI